MLIIHSFIVSVRNHPKMDLAEPQAVCLQARFLPEGVAQGTHEPRGNGQVAGLPQWTEVPSPRMWKKPPSCLGVNHRTRAPDLMLMLSIIFFLTTKMDCPSSGG